MAHDNAYGIAVLIATGFGLWLLFTGHYIPIAIAAGVLWLAPGLTTNEGVE